jgi:hypothetical protein
MALTVLTKKPKTLLTEIREGIKTGAIDTWNISDEDFTHRPDQWRSKAWLRPHVTPNEKVKFNIIRPKGSNISREVYAVYHGRFAEMLLAHFDSLIKSIDISSLADTDDLV